jgi:hypothetical protein
MFRGREAIRFCSDRPAAAIAAAVRQALGGLGQVTIDPRGAIRIEPGEWSRSRWAATALGGSLRREMNEYDVTIHVACRPTPAGWAVIVLGTPLFLLGWVAALAPLAARRTAAAAVREALAAAANALGGAAEQRYGRRGHDGPR